MPRRNDIKSILIPGSGPIVIGQASEFDYSGTQACKALRQDGFRTILVNSNPATIMTDPSLADATYIEPLTPEILEKIIIREKPDAILPTVGGQTALNLVMELDERGILEKYGVQLIGANIESINRAESRAEFKKAMQRINMKLPESALCGDIREAREFKEKNGLPLIIRPSFTLGGKGGGIAFTETEFEHLAKSGLQASPTRQILVEQSILGWKEFELEVMRDSADNVVIVCSIENLDPMGVHTGDSITIAPQQTLTDRQYQAMRDAALDIIREVGVATGGSNIQFGVNPRNGDLVVIEMNPRVSRSSALASKATGFPIAKIAALLAVGYTLDEIKNDITQVTPACFEPSIDYVVTKVPRFTFEKFPGATERLGSQMKSVGETMSIGRTFCESFQKALRGLETKRHGWGSDGNLTELFLIADLGGAGENELVNFLKTKLQEPNPERIFHLKTAMQLEFDGQAPDFSVDNLYKLTGIDPWFLNQFRDLLQLESDYLQEFSEQNSVSKETLRKMKHNGYSDRQLAFLQSKSEIMEIVASEDELHNKRSAITALLNQSEKGVTDNRYELAVRPVYKTVDTCAGEFEAFTPYLYSSYETDNESIPTKNKKIMILGGGPNRIGQGIEFDYCCCHAAYALKELEIESIMVNSNPETVSTDYDTSDRLYFEPLTFEDVAHICEIEKPDGLIVQFGGQTPLGLANRLAEAGFPIIGTPPEAIDRAEDRDRFSEMLEKLQLLQPANGFAFTIAEAEKVVEKIGFPCLVRPSYVLGGRAMAIVYDLEGLHDFMAKAGDINPEHPILIDSYLENAIEIDVDALADGEDVFVAGIMEHIEEAGVHSGDSACVIPPHSLSSAVIDEIKKATEKIALELGVCGLVNIQFAVKDEKLYVIEVNPRASRTVPFVSKAIGIPLANRATRIMCGQKISELDLKLPEKRKIVSVKEAVLPFSRFPGADIILGPEMKSTGEVMGISETIGESYLKGVTAAGENIPESGGVFFSISDAAKPELISEARRLCEMGYTLYGTAGTCDFLSKHEIEIKVLNKMRDRQSPNPLDEIQSGNIGLVINIPDVQSIRDDAFIIRQETIRNNILCITTVAGTRALVNGLEQMRKNSYSVRPLQEIHGEG